MKSDMNTMHTFGSELSCYDPHWPLEPEPRKPAAGPPASSCTRDESRRQGVRRGAARHATGPATRRVSVTVCVCLAGRESSRTRAEASVFLGGPWARD